jgi:hypothetical protein
VRCCGDGGLCSYITLGAEDGASERAHDDSVLKQRCGGQDNSTGKVEVKETLGLLLGACGRSVMEFCQPNSTSLPIVRCHNRRPTGLQ